MGRICKRTNEAGYTEWHARIRRVGLPPITEVFTTFETAQTWLSAVEAEFIDSAGAVKSARAKISHSHNLMLLPLGYLLERYAVEISPTKGSSASEIVRINSMRRQNIAKIRLKDLTSNVIAGWRDERLKVASGSTVLRELAIISHTIRIAMCEWGAKLDKNPVLLVRKPRPNPPRERRLLPWEELAILEATKSSRGGFLQSVILIALETGMRQSEIVGLDWKFVNLAARRIHLTITKNGRTRGIPLSKRAISVLEALPQRSGPVFPGVTSEAVKRAFQNACKRAKVADFHFHDLRHEAISRFVEKGLNLLEVASISGHKTMTMLMRYTHLNASSLASRLD